MQLPPRRSERATVVQLPLNRDEARWKDDADADVVEGLRRGERSAMVQFYSRNAPRIRRLLFRILGPDSELEDTVHDTFVKALESIHTLRNVDALKSWLAGVAIMTARKRIQLRRRRKWLTLMAPEALPEQVHTDSGAEVSEALKVVARVLQDIPADDRIAVVLRLAERMTMPEAASVAGVSLSTFKRRYARGEEAFRRLAGAEPALSSWFGQESE